VDGREVGLRPREMDLLLALLARRNQAVSRPTLLAEVWGYRPDARTRTVDWHVAELRRKLEPDPSAPRYLRTVRHVGYRLDLIEP
jgi:DNA-binding response OmpR family regulator